MLIDEKRLRDLYARGEIDLEHLELSLDIINQRQLAKERPASERPDPARPMDPGLRRQWLDHAASLPAAPKGPPHRACPNCKRSVRDYDPCTMHAWCEGCGVEVSLNPYERQQTQQQGSDSFWIVGGIFPLH